MVPPIIHGMELVFVDNVQYLGVLFRLTWNLELEELTHKVRLFLYVRQRRSLRFSLKLLYSFYVMI